MKLRGQKIYFAAWSLVSIASCSHRVDRRNRAISSEHIDCSQLAGRFLDPFENQRFIELAKDPAHDLMITNNSVTEAEIGIDLEKRGILSGPIVRDPSGQAEFVDSRGNFWDVKIFHSTQPNGDKIPVEIMFSKIKESLDGGENLILDRRQLSGADQAWLENSLSQFIQAKRILWYPK